MDGTRPQYREILKVLAEHQVDSIVVGGVCAVLHGAPYNTFDLDIVHARSTGNLDRLVGALASIDAYYRFHPKRITPTPSHLASTGHHLLMTRCGPLDVLGTIGDDLGYDELLPHAHAISIETGLFVQLLNLDKLIEIKEKMGRAKDLAALFVLRETLSEKLKRQAPDDGGSSPPA